MGNRLVVAGIVAGALGASCLVFTDLGGLSGGPPGAGDADVDANAEADAAAPLGDAAGDDAPSGDAGVDAGRFCDPARVDGSLFCRDFDDGEPAIFGWNATPLNDGGAFDLDPTTSVSPPNSLVATMAGDADPCSYAQGKRTVSVSATHVRLSFDVLLGATPAGGRTSYMVLGLGPSPVGSCSLILQADSSGGVVNEQRSEDGGFVNTNHRLSLAFPRTDVWEHVSLEVDRTTLSLDVLVDGKPAFATPQTLDPSCGGPGQVDVVPGLHCAQPQEIAHVVHYDDLLVELVEP